MDKRLDNWCDTALGQVRCWMDHSRIRSELEAHIEDRCAALEELDYPPELAAERTLDAMGDPVEVGRALDREHPVWIGWLWLMSVVAVFLMAIVVVIEVQESSGTLERFWDRSVETVAPTPLEEYAEYRHLLDENFDVKAAYGPEFEYVCLGVSSAAAVDAGKWTVEIPKAVWWKEFDKFTNVTMLLTVTPDRPWSGSAFENADEMLIVTSNGDEAVNLSARKHIKLGSSGFPWFRIETLAESFRRNTYCIEITIKGDADWVELSWPYGDQPWILRVEKEGAA